MDKKKKIILIVLLIAIITFLMSITYAYLVRRAVAGNSSTNTIVLQTQNNGVITVTFENNNNQIESTFTELPESEAGTNRFYMLKFSVNSTSNVSQNINIKWKDLVNTFCQYKNNTNECTNNVNDTFVGDELSYELYKCSSSQYANVTTPDDTDISSCTKISKEVNEGVPLSGSESSLIEDGYEEINASSTNYYIARIILENSNEDQSYHQGKRLGGTVNVDLSLQNTTVRFDYTGSYQTFTAPETGIYQIELWGAGYNAGGGYTKGNLLLNKDEVLYVYVGEKANRNCVESYNGGGLAQAKNGKCGISGNGATDIRLTSGAWNNSLSLNSRIMVASGAGGSPSTSYKGFGGGLTGYDGYNPSYPTNQGIGGTQILGGTLATKHSCASTASTIGEFGKGGSGGANNANSGTDSGGGSGGGGGYYGGSGSSGLCNGVWTGGGGSSFISGHTGSVAILSGNTSEPRTVKIEGCETSTTNNLCSVHYSNKAFFDTKMIDGSGYAWTNVIGEQEQMPNPSGGLYTLGVGHTGNGVAKITYLGDEHKTNLLLNSNWISHTNETIAWDGTLNGNPAYVPTFWSSGYNSGVSSPATGYHAKFDTNTFGYPVIKFPNINSTYGYINRWLGVNHPLATTAIKAGKQYRVTMEIYANTANMKINGGLYNKLIGASSKAFNNSTYDFYSNNETLNKWVKYSATLYTPSNMDETVSVLFYVYGSGGSGGTEGIAYVKNIVLEQLN